MSVRKEKFNPRESVFTLLLNEVTVGGDVLDRATFWHLTQDFSIRDLENLRSDVERAAVRYYDGIPGNTGKEKERTDRFVRKTVGSWFRPWTRLAGRIEDTIDRVRLDGKGPFDEESLAGICLAFSSREDYAPFLDREMKGFVLNRCTDLGLDYMKMPSGLRYPEGERVFLNDFPYLTESKDFDLLTAAYNMGLSCTMDLAEAPSAANGYIGGEVRWTRFLPLEGLTVGGWKVAGMGQIDYKDCTNAFVVLGDNEKAVPFYALPKEQRQAVLERVFVKERYQRGKAKTSGVKM